MSNKREIKLTVLILLIILINSFNNVSSIEVEDNYTYKITHAKISVKIGENSFYLKGVKVGGTIFPPGTITSSVISNIDQGSIDYNTTIGSNTLINYLASNWISNWDDFRMVYTLKRVYEMVDDWRNYALLSLFFFKITPYIHPCSYNWETIQNLETTLNSKYNHTEIFPKVDAYFKKELSEDVVFIESWIGGNIDGLYGEYFDISSNYNSNITFGNNFHISFINSTGIVQGLGYRGWVKGIIKDLPIKASIEYQFTLLDYNLPDYSFGIYHSFLTRPELMLIVTLPTSVILITLGTFLGIFYYRKRLTKKSNP